jgi:hypothetical protein
LNPSVNIFAELDQIWKANETFYSLFSFSEHIIRPKNIDPHGHWAA